MRDCEKAIETMNWGEIKKAYFISGIIIIVKRKNKWLIKLPWIRFKGSES